MVPYAPCPQFIPSGLQIHFHVGFLAATVSKSARSTALVSSYLGLKKTKKTKEKEEEEEKERWKRAVILLGAPHARCSPMGV